MTERTPAPEPVEVPADELAAAEARIRYQLGRLPDSDAVTVAKEHLVPVMAEYDRLKVENGRLQAVVSADENWNNAIDWLLNSRHTADPDIQNPFWKHVDGEITLDELRAT